MLIKSPELLLQEVRKVVQEREPIARARVGGSLFLFNSIFETEEQREHSPIVWAIRAHIGSLDKLKSLFTREGIYETFELLAIARNLFENLIWVRLLNKEVGYGLVFYEQLLVQQIDNTESFIAKIEGEITLFEEYELIDDKNLDAAYSSMLEKDRPTETDIKEAQEKHRALTADLDMRARRSFALYAAAAQFNGYGYQCHLLRTEVIPEHRRILADLQVRLDRLRATKATLLNSAMLHLSNQRRWNWKDRAIEVDMLLQYNFLYGYTSRLLHATPMNLVTEKELSDSETVTMMEYAFVTISDLFDEIERFRFPGQFNALLIKF